MRAEDRAYFCLDRGTMASAAALALGYLLALRLQLVLNFPHELLTVLSPANGLALSVLLASRPGRWWLQLVAVAAAATGFGMYGGLGLPEALGYAAATSAELAFVAMLLWQQMGSRAPCESFDGLLRLVTSIVIGSVLGASWRIFVALYSMPELAGDFHSLWLTWFLADALGMATVCAFLLSWFAQGIGWLRGWPVRRYLEAAALLVLAVFQSGLFEDPTGLRATGFEPLYLTFPLIIWAAVRFEVTGASGVALMMSLTAIWLTVHADGPFIRGSVAETTLALQYFLIVVVGTALTLGATIRESRRGQMALKEARARQDAYISELEAARGELEEQARDLGALAEGFARDKAEAKAANDAKSAFLATMSHELRTPMVGILGVADLLKDGELSGQQRHYVETIRKSGEALLEITNDVLDFTKIEAGRMELVERDFEVVPLVDGVTELLGSSAHAKGVALTAFVDPRVPRQLRGDPNRLRQVLVNLVGNAIKFTDAGGVSLVAEVDEVAGGGGAFLRMAVRDTGVGISPEDQARLFKRFNQVATVESNNHGGTGLGLAICKQLVGLMGGAIGVESEPGAGSTFWFTFPVQNAAAGAGVSVPSAPGWLRRALVADGNAVGREAWRRHLAALGVEVAVVPDGAAALATLSAEPAFDLVVIDEDLPGDDPIQLARHVRRDAEGGARLWRAAVMRGRRPSETSPDLDCDATVVKPLCHQSLQWCFEGGAPAEASSGAGGTVGPAGGAAARRPRAKAAGRAAKGLEARRILLAEDNKVNQMLGFAILSAAGYKVDLAASGVEAVEAAQLAEYQAVLMDVRMPEMDGREATRQIRALGGWAARVPIIAMTAEAMPEDRAECLEAGMDDHIAKPVERDELLRIIASRIHPDAPGPTAPAAGPAEPVSTLRKVG